MPKESYFKNYFSIINTALNSIHADKLIDISSLIEKTVKSKNKINMIN